MRNSNKLLSLFLSLVLVVGISIPTLSFANEDDVQENFTVEKYDRLIAETIKFRSEMGFNNDNSFVMQLVDDYIQNNNHNLSYGAVFTSEEIEALEKRIQIQEEGIPAITQHIKDKLLDNEFAGLYVDQKNGGIVNIGFKKPLNDSQKQNIKNLYDDPEMINFYIAKYTEDELNSLVEQIVQNIEYLEKEGIPLISVSTDIIQQKVIIGLEYVDEHATSLLNKLYNKDMILIKKVEKIFAESSPTHYHRPLQGGLRIYGPEGCTAAFTSRATSGTALYLITAGHCTDRIGETWSQGGTNFGTVAKRKWNGGNSDGAAITIGSSDLSYHIYGNGNHQFTTLSSVQGLSNDYVGQAVCISGSYRNSVSCGTLQTRNHTGNITKRSTGESYYFTNMRQASYLSQGGDSGSPIFLGNQLLGVHSAEGGIYSHVQYIMSDLSVRPVTGN